jgi:formylglycine-generating enzyme required for sulfatase activity
MSKSKLRNLIALAISMFCLLVTPLPAQAANKTEKDQPSKDRLVLMPLKAGEFLAQMESALIQGLAQQYEVVSGKQVIQSLKKVAGKNNPASRKKGCDEIDCLKNVATDLHAEIFATAQVTKTGDGYLLFLGVKNVMTNQMLFEKTLPCKSCNQMQVVEKFKELSRVPATVTAKSALTLEPGDVFRDCDYCPEMVVIPAGGFDMGSNIGDEKDEKPEHRVTIGQSFAMGKIEITRGQFAAFVSASGYDTGDKCSTLAGDKWEEFSGNNWRNPGYTQDDNHPVACISWVDAQTYVRWLSRQTGKYYQLPSESQWEYACRAGEHIEYCGSENADSVAWYEHNSGRATHPAAGKQANAFGLFDMSGNVGEWMEDSYHDRYTGAPSDGKAWFENGGKRVIRGGSWLSSQTGARSAFRSVSSPEYSYSDTGFRVVRTLQ